METCAICSQKFDPILIDVPILKRKPETRDAFFTLRPDSDLCHECLLKLVSEKENEKFEGKANGA